MNKLSKDECDSVGPPAVQKLLDPGGHISDYCKEMSARAGHYLDENSQSNLMDVESVQARGSETSQSEGSKAFHLPYDVAAQRITQEHLKRDKDLWTLLRSTYGRTLMEDNSVISSGSDFNTADVRSKCEEESTKMSDEQASVMSMGSSKNCDRNENGSYKFKHNITQRFSQEKQVQQSDSSSSSSNENNHEPVKRKFDHGKCDSPDCSDSSRYPNSESSNGNGSSDSCNAGEGFKSSPMPGFVLHSSGTHYVPISIHPSHIGKKFFSSKAAKQGPDTFHPISIPVNFGGPLLAMRKISIRSHHHREESADSGLSTNSSSPSTGISSNCPSLTSET